MYGIFGEAFQWTKKARHECWKIQNKDRNCERQNGLSRCMSHNVRIKSTLLGFSFCYWSLESAYHSSINTGFTPVSRPCLRYNFHTILYSCPCNDFQKMSFSRTLKNENNLNHLQRLNCTAIIVAAIKRIRFIDISIRQ